MSGWKDFKKDASKLASKVAAKTGEIADAATLELKYQGLKLRLCEQYEKLGRLTYEAMHTAEGEEAPDTALCIAEIDRIQKQMRDIKKQQDQE